MPNAIAVLLENHCDLWDVAEYLELGKESTQGKQDDAWEVRWHNLSKRSTNYVNVIYKNKLEGKLTSEMLFEYLAKQMG